MGAGTQRKKQMIRSLWIAKTGLEAQQTNMDVISNNLANVNTNGLNRTRAVFQALMHQTLRQPGAQPAATSQFPSGLPLAPRLPTAATAPHPPHAPPNPPATPL